MFSLLVVDDELELLNLAKIFLEQTGDFTVTTVTTAAEALSILENRDFDVIISDYQMPEMNGIEFLKRVRQSFGDIPFILFTGRGREEVVIAAINNGADFYLQKGGDPVAQFAELAHKIRQACRRSRAERSLVESEKRLSDIINFLPDAMLAIDRSGRVIAWNRAIEDMTGIPAGDIVGKGDFEYAIPFYGERRPLLVDLIFEPVEKVTGYYQNVLKEGNILTAETDLPHPRGHRIAVLAKASPLYNRKGEIIGAIESIRDISAWQHTVAALRESEEKYRLVVENSHDVIFIHQNDRVVFANRRASELTGFSPDELKNKNLWDLVHPDDRESLMNNAKERISGNKVASVFTARVLTKTGKVREGEFFVEVVVYQGKTAVLGIFRDITEKLEAERAIRETEERYRQSEKFVSEVIDGAKEGICVFDRELRISIWNKAMEEMTGVPARDVAGSQAVSMFPLFSQNGIPSLLEQALAGQTGESADLMFSIPATGREGWAKGIFSPHYNTKGDIIGVIGIIRDITQRKRAEEALKESEARYRSLSEASHDLIFMIDREDRVTYVNRFAAELFGIPATDIVGKERRSLFPPDTSARQREAIRQVIETGEPSRSTGPLRVNGKTIWFDHSLVPIRDASGKISQVLGISRDITEQKKTEESLRRSEEQYRNVVEDQTEFISRFTPDGTHIFVNEAYCRYFGKKREDLIGKKFMPSIPEEDLERVRQFFKSLTPDNPVATIDHRIILPEKGIRWQRWSDRAIFDPGGRVTEFQSVGRDITDLVEAREALQKERGDLVAAYEEITAADEEIRKSYADLAQSRQALSESEQRYRTIFENTGTATVIINEDTTITLANAGFERLSGYSRGEVEWKKSWTDFVVPEDLPRMLEQHRLRRVNHDRALRAYEFRFVQRDGNIRYIHLTIDTIPGSKQSVASLTDITERRETELALIRSEGLYRNILANIQDMYYRSDRGGNLILASPSATALLGYESLDEIYGKNIAETLWYHPEERQAFLDQVYRDGSVSNCIVTLKRADGTPLVVETNTHLYYDESGDIAGVEGVIRDISERRKTEDTLRESRERFQTIFDDSPVGIAIVGPDFRFRMVNRKFSGMLQYNGDELATKTFADVTHPDHREQDVAEVRKLINGESETYRTKKRYLRKDGSVLWASLTVSPIKDRGGRVIYFIALIEDITERRQWEARLADQEAFLRTLVDSMPDALMIVDWDGTCLFGNPALAHLLGYSSFEEAGAFNVRDFLEADSIEPALKDLKAVRAGTGTGASVYRIHTRSGEKKWIEAAGTRVLFRGRDADLVCIRDVTEHQRMERALHEMNQKLTLLSGVTRHDVLNKLTVLLGHITILKNRIRDPDILRSVAKAESAATAIRKQIEFTRQYEKIGRESPQWQGLAKILTDTAPHAVTLDMDVNGLEINADPMLQQVFANLFDNSLRLGGIVTEVRVRYQAEGGSCLIVYEDNGCGVPQDEKDRIFDRGYGKNTGMGLFLTRGILAITGITIAETGEPGKGARFVLTVPPGGFRFVHPTV